MNKTQLKMAIKVIKDDCKIREQYVDCHGNTCAIAALAIKAGVSVSTLKRNNAEKIGWLPNVYKKIQKKFGLDWADQSFIQSHNDAHSTRRGRQRAIVGLLKKLFASQKTKPNEA